MYQKRTEMCGERIKTALYIRRMKQCDLCKLANVPKSSLSLYLSGAYEPKQDRIYSMAKALNVSEAWLMGYDVPMETNSPNESKLTEEEIKWLEFYHSVSEETRKLAITMFTDFDNLPEDVKKMLFGMIRGVLDNQ